MDLNEIDNGGVIDIEERNIKDVEKEAGVEVNADAAAHEDLGEDDGPKLKSAAQKRAEKKEREKLKKKEAKKKAEKKDKANEEKVTTGEEIGVAEEPEVAEKKVTEKSQEGARFFLFKSMKYIIDQAASV